MGRILLTNDEIWDKELHACFCGNGFEENGNFCGDYTLRTYSKLNIETVNYFVPNGQDNDDFVACAGSLLYKGLFGADALKAIYDDADKSIEEIRKNCLGIYVIAIWKNSRTRIFVDEGGMYALHYYLDDEARHYVITNTYFHTQMAANQDIDRYAFMEIIFQFCNLGHETPFQNVYRLMYNEILEIDEAGNLAVKPCAVNHYELEGSSLKSVAKEITRVTQGYMKRLKAFSEQAGNHAYKTQRPLEPMIFATGGVDSRLIVAEFLKAGINPTLANWQGSPDDMNSKMEDREIAYMLADKFHLNYRGYNVSHDIVDHYRNLSLDDYYKYGEKGSAYGGNRKWLGIFERGDEVWYEFGYFEEVLRTWDPLDGVEGCLTLDEYLELYFNKQSENFPTVHGGFSIDTYKKKIRENLEVIIKDEHMDENHLSREDSMILYFHYRMHADSGAANFANMFGYCFTVFGQRKVIDLVLQIPYEYKLANHLNLILTRRVSPESLSIPYFSHTRKWLLDGKHMRLVPDENKAGRAVKDVAKAILSKAGLLDTAKKYKNRYVHSGSKNELIEVICEEIKRKVPDIGIEIDKDTFHYIPLYIGFLCKGIVLQMGRQGSDAEFGKEA